ncbi:peptidase inhibitor family I36 protein [Nonomuraea sp. B10E15]|uniref:peptidase inhibitor family I36 protein n=1 Tax=Nonomuraea sp. B10E15 TaxID=3153560 RepID=UPI00325C61DA
MRKVVVGSLLAVVAVVGAPGVAAVHADSRSSSAAGSFCLYEHDNYKGGRACFKTGDRDLRNNRWSGTGRSADNGASSMKNETRYFVYLYSLPGLKGGWYGARPYSSDTDLTKNSGGNPSFDNKASALVFNTW